MAVILTESFILKVLLVAMANTGLDHGSLSIQRTQDNNSYQVKKDGLVLLTATITTSKISEDLPILITLEPLNIRSDMLLSIAQNLDESINNVKIFLN